MSHDRCVSLPCGVMGWSAARRRVSDITVGLGRMFVIICMSVYFIIVDCLKLDLVSLFLSLKTSLDGI